MARKFKVGDKVVLNKKSQFYGQGSSNPKALQGTISHILPESSLPYSVRWSNRLTNSYLAKDLDKVVVEVSVKAKTYKSIYEQLMAESKLEVGDVVKVTHSVPDCDLGWDNYWVDDMNDYVGKEYTITGGIGIDTEGSVYLDNNWGFPIHVLKFVRKPVKSKTMQLTKSYEATVSPTDIRVGCQTITYKKFDELVKLVNELRAK